ncbi:MAG: PilZ domain-containing protein [Candidatus Omnitrophota bacterium]
MRYKKLESATVEFKGSLMRDISVGGASMTTYEFLPLNLKLAAEIPLVSGVRPVRGTGRVAWIRKAGYSDNYDVGLEFSNLDDEDRAQLYEFITVQKVRKIK